MDAEIWNDSYEVKLFLGSVDEKRVVTHPLGAKYAFDKCDLIRCIGKFQDTRQAFCPIRVEETVFVSGSDYMEEGWVCTAIQYPRKPLKENLIKAFMLDLADYLLENLHQKRICIMDNKTVAMCVKSWTNE